MNGKTLTAEQCSKLSLYILMTTKTREGEAATWEKLAEEKKEDAFAALSQEFERSSRILAEEWAQTSALAKIAVISESND